MKKNILRIMMFIRLNTSLMMEEKRLIPIKSKWEKFSEELVNTKKIFKKIGISFGGSREVIFHLLKK